MADAAASADAQLGAGAAALSPADAGAWQVLSFTSEVLAVHAALLHSGDVLFAAGSGNSLPRFQSPDFGDVAKKVWVSVVWDPTISPPPGGGDTNFFHPVRAENVIRGCDQQRCPPCHPAVMITAHVPAVRLPPDHADDLMAAAVPA